MKSIEEKSEGPPEKEQNPADTAYANEPLSLSPERDGKWLAEEEDDDDYLSENRSFPPL